MGFNNRLERLERGLPLQVCTTCSAGSDRPSCVVSSPTQPPPDLTPCPECGAEPLVIRVEYVESPASGTLEELTL